LIDPILVSGVYAIEPMGELTGHESSDAETSVKHRIGNRIQLHVLDATENISDSISVYQIMMTYPAPKPPRAENMPTEQNTTKPVSPT
jgi:hypothetical protein